MSKKSGITYPLGFVGNGIHAGIKKDKSLFDLAIISSEREAIASGLFTTNKIKGAPLILTQSRINRNKIKAIIINSGSSNVFTPNGLEDAKLMTAHLANNLSCKPANVLVASTGVIGESLPMDNILNGIDRLTPTLSSNRGINVAKGILTTDINPKEAVSRVSMHDGKTILVGGIAKGSGMIHPNMATLLAFITTDANITKEVANELIKIANQESFDRISIDGDTSTSDMFILLANGLATNRVINKTTGRNFNKLSDAIVKVAKELSVKIVEDAEGATKLIEIRVSRASSNRDAVKIAKSIATSSLVKTAFFGEDANWGRILMAAGNSRATINPETLSLKIGSIAIVQNGQRVDTDFEKKLAPILKKRNQLVELDLNIGNGTATVYSSDLSYDYVKINASYRT